MTSPLSLLSRLVFDEEKVISCADVAQLCALPLPQAHTVWLRFIDEHEQRLQVTFVRTQRDARGHAQCVTLVVRPPLVGPPSREGQDDELVPVEQLWPLSAAKKAASGVEAEELFYRSVRSSPREARHSWIVPPPSPFPFDGREGREEANADEQKRVADETTSLSPRDTAAVPPSSSLPTKKARASASQAIASLFQRQTNKMLQLQEEQEQERIKQTTPHVDSPSSLIPSCETSDMTRFDLPNGVAPMEPPISQHVEEAKHIILSGNTSNKKRKSVARKEKPQVVKKTKKRKQSKKPIESEDYEDEDFPLTFESDDNDDLEKESDEEEEYEHDETGKVELEVQEEESAIALSADRSRMFWGSPVEPEPVSLATRQVERHWQDERGFMRTEIVEVIDEAEEQKRQQQRRTEEETAQGKQASAMCSRVVERMLDKKESILSKSKLKNKSLDAKSKETRHKKSKKEKKKNGDEAPIKPSKADEKAKKAEKPRKDKPKNNSSILSFFTKPSKHD